jgi:hypothetical protein
MCETRLRTAQAAEKFEPRMFNRRSFSGSLWGLSEKSSMKEIASAAFSIAEGVSDVSTDESIKSYMSQFRSQLKENVRHNV